MKIVNERQIKVKSVTLNTKGEIIEEKGLLLPIMYDMGVEEYNKEISLLIHPLGNVFIKGEFNTITEELINFTKDQINRERYGDSF